MSCHPQLSPNGEGTLLKLLGLSVSTKSDTCELLHRARHGYCRNDDDQGLKPFIFPLTALRYGHFANPDILSVFSHSLGI